MFVTFPSVNLEHNNLTSLSGLVSLVNLKVLCLNHNHIECIVARPKQSAAAAAPAPTSAAPNSKLLTRNTTSTNNMMFADHNYAPVLENLEVLHLG